MRAPTFAGFITLLFMTIMMVFYHFKNHFSGAEYYEKKSSMLEQEVEQEKLNALLASYQLNEIKQQVATLLPEQKKNWKLKSPSGYPIRNLASVVGATRLEKLQYENASTYFEQAKNHYRAGEYIAASDKFKKIIEDFPSSVHVVKSYFLLVECHFKRRKYDLVIDRVDEMVTLFPEDDVTGFALLRLGAVFEYEERPEDAVDIYNVVLKTYANGDLRRQARDQLESVRL